MDSTYIDMSPFCVDRVEQDSELCRKRNVATNLDIPLVTVINSNW